MDISLRGAIHVLSMLVVICSGLIDLPRAVSVGPVTSQAILTILYLLAGTALLILTPSRRHTRSFKTLPLTLFVLWALVSLAWTTALSNGIQNVLVIGTFVVMIALGEAAAAVEPQFAFWLERQFKRSVVIAILLFLASFMWSDDDSHEIIGVRAFGLFALFGVVLGLSAWRYGKRWGLFWAASVTVLIGVSESRLALAIAIVLFPAAQLPTGRAVRLIKTFCVLAVVSGLAVASFLYSSALQRRFLTGDTSLKIGSFMINGSGRAAFWRLTASSWEESPLAGKGAGSAEGLIESVYGEIRHPHSDYLRLAHDYGLIGVAIWTNAVGLLLFWLWRQWRAADGVNRGVARIHLGALLGLLAFVLEMTAENAFVYVIITAPLGLLVGSALGLERAQPTTSRTPRTA